MTIYSRSYKFKKFAEYQLPLWICAIDFKKAFDTVEHFRIWEALKSQGVPANYIDALVRSYTAQVGKTISPYAEPRIQA